MAVKVGSARIDENGKAHGGQAGDQTGKEVSTQNWYLHSKGWRVFRAKNPSVAERIAQCMERACKNSKIGYDQYQRNTLYKVAEPLGFDTAKVTTACETDCSALVRVCIAFAGITGLPEGFRTGNMPSNLNKTGAFTELTGSKYQSQSTYLGRGDILVTKTNGHTVVVLTNGSKYEGTIHPVEYALGDRVIKYGCEGQDVKLMQVMLLKLGYDLGSWRCDGDFGDCTDLALRAFQKDAQLDVDGECGPAIRRRRWCKWHHVRASHCFQWAQSPESLSIRHIAPGFPSTLHPSGHHSRMKDAPNRPDPSEQCIPRNHPPAPDRNSNRNPPGS